MGVSSSHNESIDAILNQSGKPPLGDTMLGVRIFCLLYNVAKGSAMDGAMCQSAHVVRSRVLVSEKRTVAELDNLGSERCSKFTVRTTSYDP